MHKAPFLYLTCGVRIWTRDDSHVHCSHLLLPPRLLLAFLSDPPLAIRFLLQEGAASSPSIRVSVEESKDVLKPSRLKRPEKRKEERGGEREREREREKLDAHFREWRRGAVDDVHSQMETVKLGEPRGRRRRRWRRRRTRRTRRRRWQTHWRRCKRAKFRTQYAVSALKPIFKLSRCGARASTSLPGMPDG